MGEDCLCVNNFSSVGWLVVEHENPWIKVPTELGELHQKHFRRQNLLVGVQRLTDRSEHVKEGWAGQQALQAHIHVAIDVGVDQTFIYLVKLRHGKLDVLCKFEVDLLVLKLLALARTGGNVLDGSGLVLFLLDSGLVPETLQVIQIN